MELMEWQAGTELNQVKTKAKPHDDGSFKIPEEKIVIAFGEHQLAESIVHVVRARLPDVPLVPVVSPSSWFQSTS